MQVIKAQDEFLLRNSRFEPTTTTTRAGDERVSARSATPKKKVKNGTERQTNRIRGRVKDFRSAAEELNGRSVQLNPPCVAVNETLRKNLIKVCARILVPDEKRYNSYSSFTLCAL